MVRAPLRSVEVEYLGLGADALVGVPPSSLKKLGHLCLPPGVDFGCRHGSLSGGEVVAFEVPDEGAVVTRNSE